MANTHVNQVIYGSSILIDLREDTITADKMYKGITAHAKDGSIITGTAEITVVGTKLILPNGLITIL